MKNDVTINGLNNSITFSELENISDTTVDDGLIISGKATVKNLTVDAGLNERDKWVGTYAIHVYDTEATLINVTATGANGGILVNGSNVTLEGVIDVSGNGYGGIEVSVGSGLNDETLLLDVTNATLINSSEDKGHPTIWEDGVNDGVTIGDKQFTIKKINDQVHYYLNEENAKFVPENRIHLGSTRVSGVELNSDDGRATLILNYELDESGTIIGKARDDLNNQKPGKGAQPGFGFGEVFVERPSDNVTYYRYTGTTNRPTEDWPSGGSTGEVPYPVTIGKVVTSGDKTGVRWYIYVAHKIDLEPSEWKPIPDHSYSFEIEWYEGDPENNGQLVAVETIEINTVNQSKESDNDT